MQSNGLTWTDLPDIQEGIQHKGLFQKLFIMQTLKLTDDFLNQTSKTLHPQDPFLLQPHLTLMPQLH
jgi:hypothetical protein